MPGLFARLKSKDGSKKKKNGLVEDADLQPSKPSWTDAYTRKTVEPEEIHALVRACTEELKNRGLDQTFLLLPFRPTSDPSAVRTFIRHFFSNADSMIGERLAQELRMTEPMVIAGVVKWCWSRLHGGVVGWDAYELFKIGEIDSRMARDSFKTFIPISVENGARQRIIFDFFDLLAAVAAHGKSNGLGGRKLSRMAAWWAFEPKDESTSGFEGGYKAWQSAADATSHLFFAYLRSLLPEQNTTGISMLPISLQKLLQETEYPPQTPELMMTRTNKVVMIVDAVSPTPFALLRRTNNFEYRDSDKVLQEFSAFEDPVQVLSDECRRVLKAISAANQSQISSSKHSTGLRDASWSRFEDIGFSATLEEEEDDESAFPHRRASQDAFKRTTGASLLGIGNGVNRPTTPSWADFLSSGFVDDDAERSNLLLPPDHVLPPLNTETRQRSSQSHHPRLESDSQLQPGELASITTFDLDETFWWVWISSLAPEETPERKAAFGRCAVIETKIRSGRWLVMEEMVVGAAPEPVEGAYIAEKKGLFSWTKRGRSLGRRKSVGKQALDRNEKNFSSFSVDRTGSGPDAHAKIQAKAAQLRAQESQEKLRSSQGSQRQVRSDADYLNEKTQPAADKPNIGEVSSALKWVKKYDKGTIKEAYMADNSAGRGTAISSTSRSINGNGDANGNDSAPVAPEKVPLPDDPPTPQPPQQPPAEEKKPEPEPEKEPSPVPPPKDIPLPESNAAETAALTKSTTTTSVHKEPKEKTGLRKLFSRRNRTSKLPDGASKLSGRLAANEASNSAPPAPVKEEPEPSTTDASVDEENNEPTLEEHPNEEPLAQVTTKDAEDADSEFARFSQGPLTDQPAFVPEDEDDPNDATPPPIARQRPMKPHLMDNRPEDKLSQSAGPGVQDRWAQIRKNAAERAAQKQQDGVLRQGRPNSEGEDDNSGEETIESRVARIKARVAELTGNMDTTSRSNQGSPARSPAPRSPEARSPSSRLVRVDTKPEEEEGDEKEEAERVQTQVEDDKPDVAPTTPINA